MPGSGGAPLPKTLFGYAVVARIGEGALSTIYAVNDPRTQQLYALKHVIPSDEKHLRFIDQLKNEFEVSRLFRHPGLRKSIDLKLRKRLFGGISEAALVMELVDGVTLERSRPAEIPGLIDVFQRAGVALAALHHLRHLHCDIKPSNILRLADGNVKLIDFGQACPSGTIKKRVQGTPDYIAPEQVRCKTLNYYTDVYGFGATLYWALTSQKAPTLYTVKRSQRDILKEQNYPRPHELNPSVPEGLSELVMDCVRVNPGYRPESIGEVLKRLEPYGPVARS
jgi:serine/threonine protein kinase